MNQKVFNTKSDSDSSLYISILRELRANGAKLHELKEKFKQSDLDPGDDKLDLFLKELIHQLWDNGNFSESEVELPQEPTVFLQLKLLLGRKEITFAEQIDNYIAKIKEGGVR